MSKRLLKALMKSAVLFVLLAGAMFACWHFSDDNPIAAITALILYVLCMIAMWKVKL